jgi:hypothetical protein
MLPEEASPEICGSREVTTERTGSVTDSTVLLQEQSSAARRMPIIRTETRRLNMRGSQLSETCFINSNILSYGRGKEKPKGTVQLFGILLKTHGGSCIIENVLLCVPE